MAQNLTKGFELKFRQGRTWTTVNTLESASHRKQILALDKKTIVDAIPNNDDAHKTVRNKLLMVITITVHDNLEYLTSYDDCADPAVAWSRLCEEFEPTNISTVHELYILLNTL